MEWSKIMNKTCFCFQVSYGSTSMQMTEHVIAEKHVLEGNDVILSCNLTTTTGDTIQWYHRYPKSRPEFRVSIYVSDTGKQSVKADKKPEDLKISSAAVSDSAVYYCALRPTVTGNLVTLNKNLLSGKESAYTLL
ncbi:hypothetical protein QTP70_016670 [Hemibagrus guttatus]|uniref:Ig-like domain-containing protein n=1 Tax=Hemibagrus guttatus TaxID=175788 RepID=A0AAE0R7L7_9TELE|nr:hypothetical protein QTP70_016670 [Hemibagrus guttatus]